MNTNPTRHVGRADRRNHTRHDAPHRGFTFAPGAIEHHRRPIATPSQWRALGTWAQRAALLFAAVFLVSTAAGYLTGITA